MHEPGPVARVTPVAVRAAMRQRALHPVQRICRRGGPRGEGNTRQSRTSAGDPFKKIDPVTDHLLR
jgi:hypothetical protein